MDHPKRDRPLKGAPYPSGRLHPLMYAAEFVGTALLVFVGLSVVIAMNAPGAPGPEIVPDAGARRAITGFLFGSTGAAIAFSAIGRISGAHINPAMTFAFWLEGKIAWRDAAAYVLAQLAGAIAGAVPLLAWGSFGAGVGFGVTVPKPGIWIGWPLAGEILSTFLLVLLIFACAGSQRWRSWTPLVNPPLFCILVWLEAPLSGTSANPARSLGPATIAHVWQQFWIYAAGPLIGAAFAVLAARLEASGRLRPLEARLFHFGHPGNRISQSVHTARPT